MIKVRHRNIELKALIEKGKSSAYRKLEAKNTFLKALRSFFVVIGILNDIEGLRMYRQYNYIKGVDIEGASFCKISRKRMLFLKINSEKAWSFELFAIPLHSLSGTKQQPI